MMKLELNIENIDDAIAQIEKLEDRIENFPMRVIVSSSSRVGYAHMGGTHNPKDGVSKVIAGGDQIAFQEFGAGFTADTTVLETSESGYKVSYPGVWSKEHAGTFQRYRESGNPPLAYPYNRLPEHRMTREAERLDESICEEAERWFS